MTPSEFITTLYLGDRACKAIVIDSWDSCVRVQVDCISRVRSPSGTWDYYTDEDINNAFLVFSGVSSFELQNAGYLPNDSINSLEVVKDDGDKVTIEMSIDSAGSDGYHHETFLRVECKSIHLEDPAQPGVQINT